MQEYIIRKDFTNLKIALHFNNNDKIDCNNKLFKIRKLIEYANAGAQKFGIKDNDKPLVDESGIHYFGHNRLKQFIHKKPIYFRCKVGLYSSDSY